MVRRNIRIIWVSAAATAVIVAILWLVLYTFLSSDTFYKGIAIEGIDISGLDWQEAHKAINDYLDSKYGNEKIMLTYENNLWTFRLQDISYKFLVDEALARAYRYGRQGNTISRLKQIADLRKQPVRINAGASFDREQLVRILENIKKDIDKKEKNAVFEYTNGEIKIHPHETGKRFDVEKNINIITDKILNREFGVTTLAVEDILPEITYEKLKSIDGVAASFTTYFDAGDANRTHNIKLACSKLNNRLIMPGETFSMDKALGPRTVENGYKDAPVILKNELVEGIGGGICQVTTTLYNAVLLSHLEIVERSHHSWPLGYVEPGLDATISEGSIDFKFRNNHETPVALSASVSGNKLNIIVLGKKDESGTRTRLISEIISVNQPTETDVKIDNTLEDNVIIEDSNGKNGIKVVVYRESYINGKVVKKEKISEDTYKPVNPAVKMNSRTFNNIKDTFKYGKVIGEEDGNR